MVDHRLFSVPEPQLAGRPVRRGCRAIGLLHCALVPYLKDHPARNADVISLEIGDVVKLIEEWGQLVKQIKLHNAFYGSAGGAIGSVIYSLTREHDHSWPNIIGHAIVVGVGCFVLLAIFYAAMRRLMADKSLQP
jgi:hypothetical protein